MDIEAGDLEPLQSKAKELGIRVIVGVAERVNHSVYCSAVHIDGQGRVINVHRKVMPTFHERLVWSNGDGHGLRAVKVNDGVTVSALNCWENWLPLTRAALYGQGTNVHVALWPGKDLLTEDITPFIAKEGRMFVISAGSTLTVDDFKAENVPHAESLKEDAAKWDKVEGDIVFNGGTCIAGPDGQWLVRPQVATRLDSCAVMGGQGE